MDSDDFMPDTTTAAVSHTTTGHSLADPSQSDAHAGNGGGGPGAWNTKKFRDEYETVKQRLIDTKFSCAHYPDPLLYNKPRPRDAARAAALAEKERMLKEVIAQAKASVA